MSIKGKTVVVTAALALGAVPAYAAGAPSSTPPGYNGSTNPGTQQQPANTPPGYNGSNNPGSTQSGSHQGQGSQPASFPGTANPPTTNAVGLNCLKQGFPPNTSTFRACVKAGVAAIRASHSASARAAARSACKKQHFHGKPAPGARRNAYGACVSAAMSSIRSARH